MIYICSTYTVGLSKLPKKEANDLLENRYLYAQKVTADFLKKGVGVFSPIVYTHPLAQKHGLPKEYPFWQKLDRGYINKCSSVLVLKMEDSTGSWADSVGISDEVSYARSIGLPVEYLDCEDYS